MVPRMSRKVTVDDGRLMPRLIGLVFRPMNMSEGCQHECQHQGNGTNKGGRLTHGLSIARRLRNRQPTLRSDGLTREGVDSAHPVSAVASVTRYTPRYTLTMTMMYFQ